MVVFELKNLSNIVISRLDNIFMV